MTGHATIGRQVGESYKDCVARLSGELRAARMDLERLAAENERLKAEARKRNEEICVEPGEVTA